MPRTRRIALVGHPHVVVARGNNGGRIFFGDADFESYLTTLREIVRERHVQIFAWCLMKNELRLVVTPQRLPLAQVIQRLHTSHVRRINERHQRRGHLFEGRFRSVVIPGDRVIEAVRWVHLWPVRSGRVRRPDTYPWSSHRAYVKGDEWGDVVDALALIGTWGPTLPMAQRSFSRYVEAAALEPDTFPFEEVIAGVGGDRHFAEGVLAEAGVEWRGRRRPAIATLARRVSLLMGVSLEDLTSRRRQQELVMARRLLATGAVRNADLTITEVAAFLGRDKAQVSRLVQQGMSQVNDEAFAALLEALKGRGSREAATEE
jgi:REP element-mobilizing transposase RayT